MPDETTMIYRHVERSGGNALGPFVPWQQPVWAHTPSNVYSIDGTEAAWESHFRINLFHVPAVVFFHWYNTMVVILLRIPSTEIFEQFVRMRL